MAKRRMAKLDGHTLPYALSDWQETLLIVEAMRRFPPRSKKGPEGALRRPRRPGRGAQYQVELAHRWAQRFFHADLVADNVLWHANRDPDVALRQLQRMLDDGAIDAWALMSIVEEAGRVAVSRGSRASASVPRKRGAIHNAMAEWNARAPGTWSKKHAAACDLKDKHKLAHSVASIEKLLKGVARQPGRDWKKPT